METASMNDSIAVTATNVFLLSHVDPVVDEAIGQAQPGVAEKYLPWPELRFGSVRRVMAEKLREGSFQRAGGILTEYDFRAVRSTFFQPPAALDNQ